MSKTIPPQLALHILPFNWDVKLVWELDCEITRHKRKDFDYLLDLPLWSSRKGEGMLFDVSPQGVINNPSKVPFQYERILSVDTQFPVDSLNYQNKIWVLDGVHRIAKLYMEKVEIFSARIHPECIIPKIIV